jgi:4-oxalocrotonate tautomerase
MPIIEVNMLEGRSVTQKRAMVAAITDSVVATLGVKPDSVRVLIREMPAEHFAVAGVTKAESAEQQEKG